MYADDLILLSDSKIGLQNQIDKMVNYCDKWKVELNIKKTKVMVFNRGNKLIKCELKYKNELLECVKQFKYLGITISAKNCNFHQTINDASIKATRAIFALNNKFKISKLPKHLALKLFNSLVSPILLYGSEIWGPYIDYDYKSWEKSKIERIQTQFIKRLIGCNVQTSSIMARSEVGARPLLLNIIKRVINYTKSLIQRPLSTVYTAYRFESENDIQPNFCTFLNKYNFNCANIHEKSKYEIAKICSDSYGRLWWDLINESPKAISFVKFKRTIIYEKYLDKIINPKYKTALSRFRMSNHNLLIEKGRYVRPRLDRNERKCFNCKDEIEDEYHFIIKCPLYTNERRDLIGLSENMYKNFNSLSDEQKFVFILSNENENILETLARFIFHSLKNREQIISQLLDK